LRRNPNTSPPDRRVLPATYYRLRGMPDNADGHELLDEARRLIDLARERDIVLRLLGGLAIGLLCPELPVRKHPDQDLDFGSLSSNRRALSDLLGEEGYQPDRNFNALYGNKHLYFARPDTGVAVDVLVDRLHMCHTLEFADRLARLPYTLDPMDLLLSKLQIVELNEKDVDDCLRLLVTFELAESDDPSAMDARVFSAVVGDDWGWWRTVTHNLERISAVLADGDRPAIAGGRLEPRAQIETLERIAEETPKSGRWKRRSRIGERKRWYELPEETPHH
jgi:hypothetical protein